MRLAVDDFGTGFSWLATSSASRSTRSRSTARSSPASARDPRSGAIVHATIAFAKALGLTVTAEGIETEDQFERLRDLGADLGQGYLFARPLDPIAADAYLINARRATAA